MKFIILLFLIFSNFIFTHSTNGDGGGGSPPTKRRKTVWKVPAEGIIDVDLLDETAGNAQAQIMRKNAQIAAPHQNMPQRHSSGHQTSSGQTSQSATCRKRKPDKIPTHQAGLQVHNANTMNFRDIVQQLTGSGRLTQNPFRAANIHGQQQQLHHHDVPQKNVEIIDLLDDDEEEEPNGTGENPQQISPQIMPPWHSSGHPIPSESALSEFANSGKMDEIGAPSTHQIGPPMDFDDQQWLELYQNPSLANLYGGQQGQQQQLHPNPHHHEYHPQGNFHLVDQPMMPTAHHQQHHSPQEFPPEREIPVIQSSVKMGGNQQQLGPQPNPPPSHLAPAQNRPAENIVVPPASKGKAIVGETSNASKEVITIHDDDPTKLKTEIASILKERKEIMKEMSKIQGSLNVLRDPELIQRRKRNGHRLGEQWAENISELGTLTKRIEQLANREAFIRLELLFPYKTKPEHFKSPSEQMQSQFKMVEEKLKEKIGQKVGLSKKTVTIANMLAPLQLDRMAEADGPLAELAQTLAELANVEKQVEALERQEKAVIEQMDYEEKVRGNPRSKKLRNKNIEKCGPGPFQCDFCDLILCGVYDSCQWNLDTWRCLYGTPTQN